jgi:hypothetical protein
MPLEFFTKTEFFIRPQGTGNVVIHGFLSFFPARQPGASNCALGLKPMDYSG